MEEEIIRFKNKKKNISNIVINEKRNKHWRMELIKILIAILITLTILIMSKSSKYLDKNIKKIIFEDTFDFSGYMSKYSKYFSEFLPFEKILNSEPVFNEEMKYSSINKYLDGVSLTVQDKYLVPNMGSGLIVYIGEKEDYGKVVIVQQVDGIDMWYGNLENVAVNLYDYIEKGSLIGETKDELLYIVLEKEGKYLDYEEYF